MCVFKSNGSCSVMNTRYIAAEYRLSHWAGIMQERSASGLSIRAFCKQLGIGGNTYFYWQRKLREAAARQMPGTSTAPSRALVPSGWAVCEETKAAAVESGITVEIGKCRVAVGADASSEQLAKVCKVLMTLC